MYNFPVIVNTLLKSFPARIVNGIDIRAVGEPHAWFSEINVFFFAESRNLCVLCVSIISRILAAVSSVQCRRLKLVLAAHGGHAKHLV